MEVSSRDTDKKILVQVSFLLVFCFNYEEEESLLAYPSTPQSQHLSIG